MKLKMTVATNETGGVEDMLSAPYFGSDVRPLPPTFGEPDVCDED